MKVETKPAQSVKPDLSSRWSDVVKRRSFLQGLAACGESSATAGSQRLLQSTLHLSKIAV
jgi:hypothetical protein